MSHLNWRTPEHYSYVEALDTNGVAWEFIRRSKSYKAAYAKLVPDAANPEWRKEQLIIAYEPERRINESENAWLARADDLGVRAIALTPSMSSAREWGLLDLYDPEAQYDPLSVAFCRKNKGLQVFLDTDVYDGSQGVSPETADVYRKCTPLSELGGTHMGGRLAVLFDLSAPWTPQIETVNEVFMALQILDSEKTDTRNNAKKNTEYLRFLDGKLAEPHQNDTVLFSIIVDDEVARDADQLARAAHKMKKRAEEKAESYHRQ